MRSESILPPPVLEVPTAKDLERIGHELVDDEESEIPLPVRNALRIRLETAAQGLRSAARVSLALLERGASVAEALAASEDSASIALLDLISALPVLMGIKSLSDLRLRLEYSRESAGEHLRGEVIDEVIAIIGRTMDCFHKIAKCLEDVAKTDPDRVAALDRDSTMLTQSMLRQGRIATALELVDTIATENQFSYEGYALPLAREAASLAAGHLAAVRDALLVPETEMTEKEHRLFATGRAYQSFMEQCEDLYSIADGFDPDEMPE